MLAIENVEDAVVISFFLMEPSLYKMFDLVKVHLGFAKLRKKNHF